MELCICHERRFSLGGNNVALWKMSIGSLESASPIKISCIENFPLLLGGSQVTFLPIAFVKIAQKFVHVTCLPLSIEN